MERRTHESPEAEIGAALGQLHAQYYGHGPRGVSVHITNETVVVLFEETFTQAEQVLIDRGEAAEVQAIRRRFQRVQADDFVSVVERTTGRAVRSFVSDTDLGQHLSIEVFVLGATREDMSAFEDSMPDDEDVAGEA